MLRRGRLRRQGRALETAHDTHPASLVDLAEVSELLLERAERGRTQHAAAVVCERLQDLARERQIGGEPELLQLGLQRKDVELVVVAHL
eukprot:730364-Prymnesium_polylepis.1